MLIGVGMDLAEVSFWADAVRDPATAVVEETFTVAERAYAQTGKAGPAQHLAARFAAKEAFIKAIGAARAPRAPALETVALRDIEVQRDRHGRPSLSLSGTAQTLAEAVGVRYIALSLTHTATTAGAVVVLEA